MPRYADWAYQLALDGAGSFNEEGRYWTVPVEWEDSILFPELKGVASVFVREESHRVDVSLRPFPSPSE